MPSQLLTELASIALEAQNITGENFTWKGSTYQGVMGTAPLAMRLELAGYGEAAAAQMQATLAQFGTAPTKADAANRELVTLENGQAWKCVSVENDGLHIKFGLVSNV